MFGSVEKISMCHATQKAAEQRIYMEDQPVELSIEVP